jgi:hypothetical protein
MACIAESASVSPELAGVHGGTDDQPPTDCDLIAAATAVSGTASHQHTSDVRASMNADDIVTYDYPPSFHSPYTLAHDDAMMHNYDPGAAPW